MLFPFTGPLRGQHILFSDCLHREKDLPHIELPLCIFRSSLKLTPRWSYRVCFLLSFESLSDSCDFS